MSQIEKDFRAYLVNDSEIGAVVGVRVHYGNVPQGPTAGEYIWFARRDADKTTDEVLAGEPDQLYAFREAFDVECVSSDPQKAVDLAGLVRRLDGRNSANAKLVFGAGSCHAITVDDQRDDYVPHGIGDDEGRDVAALSVTLIGYSET